MGWLVRIVLTVVLIIWLLPHLVHLVGAVLFGAAEDEAPARPPVPGAVRVMAWGGEEWAADSRRLGSRVRQRLLGPLKRHYQQLGWP